MNLSVANRALLVLVLSLAGIGVHAEEQNPMTIVKANFQAADADGNGSLDSREFPALIDANAEHKIGRAAMVKRFGAYVRAFNKADRDGDGAVAWSELMSNRPEHEDH